MYKIYLRHAYPNELYHHGILGQKWGIRRYQNKDGSLTAAGKKRYSKFNDVRNSIENDVPDDMREHLSSVMKSMTRNPINEMKIQKEVYNSLSRDEQLDLIRGDAKTTREYYNKIKAKRTSDSVQNKIQNFEKLGFKDDGEPTEHSIWLEKSVNNKGRKATLVVAVDKDGEDDLGGDFSKTVKRLENNIGRIDDVGKKHIHDSFKSEYGGKVPAYKLSDMQLRIVGPDACELSYTLNSPGIEGGYVQTNFNPRNMKPQGRVYHD